VYGVYVMLIFSDSKCQHILGQAPAFLPFLNLILGASAREETPWLASHVVFVIFVVHGPAFVRRSFVACAAFKRAELSKRCAFVLALSSVLLLLGAAPLLFDFKTVNTLLAISVAVVSRIARLNNLLRSEPPHGLIMGSR
jgi:hypothetical protein